MFGDLSEEAFVTMEDVCKIITDGTHQPPKFVSEGIPFLFVSNIVTNEITYNTEKFITPETYAELIKRTPIEVGDILLSTVGSYGHPAIVKSEKLFCFQRHIAYLKPDTKMVNSEYVKGAILSFDVQRQIDERVKGIAQKTLNLSEIRKLRLPLPPLDLQNQFADFVAQVDKSKLVAQKSLKLLERIVNCKQEVLLTERRVRMNTGIKPQVLQEICELAVKYGVEQVILFGSRARGDHWAKSDIDLAIRGGDGVRFALDVEAHASTLLTFDIVDLNEAIAPELRDSIAREGVVLYEKV